MKRMKLNRIFSIAMISCLVVTGTPLKAFAEEVSEARQWQEILTTFEGDLYKNSLDEGTSASGIIQKEPVDMVENRRSEKSFSLEAANSELKTDRFIVKYKDKVEIRDVVDISDLSPDPKEENSLKRSMPVEISSAQLDFDKVTVDSAKVIESENLMILSVKEQLTGAEFKDILKTEEIGKEIEYIQPDYELGMSAVDPYRDEQWGHYQMYSPPSGEDSMDSEAISIKSPYRMDANVLEAWDKSKGEDVIVALLDTGIETNHVDLQNNLLDGWDFVNNDESVNDFEWKYDQWHGTHIAGIIAAEADNNVGITGVAPKAKVLPLKVFQGGTAYTSDIISAIKYAELNGAKIANCSWGTLYDNPALEEAIKNSDMIFVCAAGNSLYNTDKYPVYPASYDLEHVISVTSIDPDGRLSRFANYGTESVDIAAPGRDIYSTTIDNGFAQNSGTSMSAGYVSGALALLLSKDQTKTAEELKERILESGDIVTGLMDKVKDGKKLNCDYALTSNPFPNINTIIVEDDEPLPEISPNDESGDSEYETHAEKTISIKTPMPTARHGLGVIAVGDKIYAIGGQLSSGYSNKVEEYDPRTDTWITKTNMPTASSYFGIAKVNDMIYVLGGYNGSYLNIVQRYNPATDVWTTMPTAHNMPIAMRYFAATAYDGKLYVTGGYNGSYRNTVYEYNPETGAWTQKQSLLNNRGKHVAIEYDGKIYIDGGCTTSGKYFSVEEVYDPATNQVQQTGVSRIHTNNGAALNIGERYVLVGGRNIYNTNMYDNNIVHKSLNGENSILVMVNSMYYSRAGLGIAEVNGKVYMIGGINSSGVLSAVEEIDLGWEVKANLPAEMKNFTSIECNGKLYLIGGEILSDSTNVRIKSVYEYNPQTNTWIQKADMPEYRVRFAVGVAYGKIYIIGGGGSTASTGGTIADNKVYEFDPVRDTWTRKAGISSARYDISAANYNNQIYIAGGRKSSENYVSNVEIFNPLDGTWQSKQNLPQANAGHLLTVANGKLLLIGGTNYNVWEYNSLLDTWSTKYSDLRWSTYPYNNSLINLYGNIFNFGNIKSIKKTPAFYKYDPIANVSAYYFSFYLFNKTFNTVTLNNKVYTFDGPGSYAQKMIEYRPPTAPWLHRNHSGIGSGFMGIGTLGSDIYHIGGQAYDASGYYPTSGAMKLNTQTNSWTAIRNMNYVRSDLAVGSIAGKIYAAGGRNTQSMASAVPYLEEYEPSTDSWTVKANIPSALFCMAYAVHNGKLYLFGGTDGSSVFNTTYIYDPQTDVWTTGANMPTFRYACSAEALSDGKIYVVGGNNSSNVAQKKIEAYDPVSNTWTTKQDMPAAWAFSGVTGKDSLYVVGGKNNSEANGLVYEYSPVTNKWFTWQGPGLALYGVGVTIANNGIYVINGLDISNAMYVMVNYLPLGSYNADYIHLGEESVNLSGNLARNYTDMSYTSQGFQINFSRTYNTRDDRTEGNIISKGWTFGFQGKVSSAGNDTLVRLPNGSGYYFKENIDGTFVARDSRSTLVKQADGSYTMTTKDLYSYGFNSSGYLTWMKDRNGNTITITVDSAGKVTQITDPMGRQANITYSSDRIWKITDFAGRTVEYAYNASGYLSTVTDPMGNVTRYTYNSGGVLTEVKDHNNNLMESFTYYDIPSHETLPRVKTVTDSLGKTQTNLYDEGEGTVTVTDNNDRQNITWYDKMLYPIRIKDTEGKEQRIEYNLSDGVNKYGEERVVIDRRGNAIYYDRDANGNIIRRINPDGSMREYAYDVKNNLISEKDELGKLTFYVYDGNQINLLKTVKPLNGTDVYSDTAPQGSFAITSNTYYTSAEAQTMCGKAIDGILKTVTDPNGGVATYTYDAYGNIATVKNALNQTAAYQYNPLGWLKQEISVKGYTTRYYYDRNGNVVKKTGHGGETERIVFDSRGRITQNILPNQYAAASDTASAYNTNNILTNANTYGVAGAGYRYAYFASGLLQTETDPLNYVTGYTYDQYGNILTKTCPNGYIEIYAYDVLNRFISTSHKESSSSSAVTADEYDYHITSQGHLEKIRTHHYNSPCAPETAVSKETYDYADRLIRTDNADGGYSVNEYAANGNLSVTTDPMGSKTYYAYDGLNREIGKWSEVSSGACIYEGREYDKKGNLLKVKTSGNIAAPYSVPSSDIRYDSFLYDGIGRTIEQGDSQGGRTTYTYADATDTVTQRQYTSGSQYVETVDLFNHFGKVKETNLKVNSDDMVRAVSNLKTSYTFDKEGNILTETGPDNVAMTYTYDLLGRRLTSSRPGINENGQAATLTDTYTYDFRGNIMTQTDSLGRTTTHTYTVAGLLLKTTDAKGGVTYMERTPDNLLISEVTPKNYTEGATTDQMNRKIYQYDSMGRVIKEENVYKDSSGAFQTITKEYTYDKNGNLLTSKDGKGYLTSYTYDRQNRQLTALDPEARDKGLPFTVKNTYNGLGQVTAIENGVHAVTSYTYNDQGKVLTTAVGGVTKKTYTYDLVGNLLSESDGNGNTTSYTYNALGKVRTQVLPEDESISSHTVSYQYTDLGAVAKSADTLDRVNIYTYDNQQNMLSEMEQKVDGSGAITKSYRYDLAGNLRFSVDGRGSTTEYTYDALNQKREQKVSVTVNGTLTTQTTSYAYDADGNPTSTTDWLGNQYLNVYDNLGRLITKKDPYGNVIEELIYDSNHRQIASKDALGNVVTFAYDKANRLILKTDASGDTEGKNYDAAGNIISATDGNGNETEYQHDADNRLLAVTNALGEVNAYTYDVAGNLLTQTDGKGNITTYEYNARNLPVTRIDAGGIGAGGVIDASMAETYQYRSDGMLSSKTDRNGIVTTYAYDAHGRLLTENAGGELVSYTYDNNNNQLTMTDATGTTTRVYDELNRVISKTVPVIGTTVFAYDQTAGLPAGATGEAYTDPKGNTVVRITDKAGRPYQVKDGSNTTTYTYYANGNLRKLEYPNGAAEEYTYYANNKLHTLINKQGISTLEAFSYEYDGAGNMTGKADRKGITGYTYDDLNRLLSVSEPDGKETAYEYDTAGNRAGEAITEGSEVTRTEYEYNGQNRLTGTKTITDSEETGGTEYTFDNNGNVLSVLPYTLSDTTTSSAVTIGLSVLGNPEYQNPAGAAIYEYDARNQMIKAVQGGYTVESGYNGEGLRVSKTVNGETSNYLYEYDRIILETNGSNAQVARNVYGTSLISRTAGGDTLYYLYNGHGDVTSLRTASGAAAAQYYYDAFGTITEETGTVSNPFRYAGYEYDGETNLYYLKSRMYDSITARFLQEDTYRGQANDPLSLNLYTYCHNNPIIYDDPSGHGIFKAIAAVSVVRAVINAVSKNKPKSGNSSSSGGNSSSSSGNGSSSGGNSSSSNSNSNGNSSSSSSPNNIGIPVVDQILSPLRIIFGNLRELGNTNDSTSVMGAKATNDVAGLGVNNIIYPDDTLKRFIQIGGGKMWVDENDRTLIHATVRGISVDYRFENGVLYDAKTKAIVGMPEKSGDAKDYVKVSGNYYNFTFGGAGYAKTSIQNIGGKDHVVYKVDNQTYLANGNPVGGPANKPINQSIPDSAKAIQDAFQNSIRGGNFDNSKNGLQCVDLTKWFISTYTDLQWVSGNGWEQAAKTAAKNGLPAPSSTPKAWSVFSVEGWHKGWGSRGTSDAGHTGIVISVDEVNKTATVIQTGHTYEDKNPNSWIDIYSYPTEGVTFTYIGDHIK